MTKVISLWGVEQLLLTNTGWPIKIKPHRNLYTKGCVKMKVLQQQDVLFIVNL